jgi:hypothetical protein
MNFGALALLFLIPVALIGWGIYVLRIWSGLWRYAAALPALLIILDGASLLAAGGYAAGTIVGLNFGALLVMCVLSGLHRARTLRAKLPPPRHSA